MNKMRSAQLKSVFRFIGIFLLSIIGIFVIYKESFENILLFSFLLTGVSVFLIEIIRFRHRLTNKEERSLRKKIKWERKHSSLQYEWIFSKGYGKKRENKEV